MAEGLRFVEQVIGRLGFGTAALHGALSGAVTGAFIGFILGLFNIATPLVSVLSLGLSGLVFGAIIGAVIGLIGYAFSGGRRDFSSVRGVQAERYTVMVDEEVADGATHLLSTMVGGSALLAQGG